MRCKPYHGRAAGSKTAKEDAWAEEESPGRRGRPCGNAAAITAANRGHEVILAEKSDKLGGNLHPAGAAYFKEDIRKLIEVMEKRVSRAGVDVRLNTDVTPAYVKETEPDVLFVAIGSNECARQSRDWILTRWLWPLRQNYTRRNWQKVASWEAAW